eukprot:485821-Amphidinium_carterae.2
MKFHGMVAVHGIQCTTMFRDTTTQAVVLLLLIAMAIIAPACIEPAVAAPWYWSRGFSLRGVQLCDGACDAYLAEVPIWVVLGPNCGCLASSS